MPNYSNITVVAVLDNNGELHKINYEQLANLPSSMKNPHALIIFGQKYDGSSETTITPSLATSTTRGCVMPVAKTSEMIQDVGVDATGKLYTKGFTVDQVVTAFSTNPVSSDGVRNYVTNNTVQINQTIQQTKEEIEQASKTRDTNLQKEIDTVETSVQDLQTSTREKFKQLDDHISSADKISKQYASDISDLKTANSTLTNRVTTNEQDIQFNKDDITSLKPQVSQLQDDLDEVKSRNIGYFFSSISAMNTWLANDDNKRLLGVGVCLYITGNTSLFFVWNGTQAIQVNILNDIAGGYLSATNPAGSGYFKMNNNEISSGAAAFGFDNIAGGLYSFVAGHGVSANNEAQSVVGKYNATPKSDEMFSVGAGTDAENRKTVYAVTNEGTSRSYGDVTAFDDDLDALESVDKGKAKITTTISNMPDNVKVGVNYDYLVSEVTQNNLFIYTFTYTDGHWSSPCYDFSYIANQQTQYYPIDNVGISFEYKDGQIAEIPIDFVDGDTITVYAPLQKTISLREVYNTVSAVGLYVDEDGDVCQED